jgi:hypothetical protein
MSDWKVISAKRLSICEICGQNFSKGESISWSRNLGVIRCPVHGEDEKAPIKKKIALVKGEAGGSAKAQYEKRSKADSAKVTFLRPRLAKLFRVDNVDSQTTKNWKKGAIGEQVIGGILDTLSFEFNFKVLHDRAIPGSKANIDHILISDRGVFVIDSKNYRGLVRINSEGGILTSLVETLYVGNRKQTTLVNGVKKQVSLVQKTLDEQKILAPVKGVLAFYDADWPLLFKPQEIDGVLLNSKGVKAAVLAQFRIDGLDIEKVSNYLEKFFPAMKADPVIKSYRTPKYQLSNNLTS